MHITTTYAGKSLFRISRLLCLVDVAKDQTDSKTDS